MSVTPPRRRRIAFKAGLWLVCLAPALSLVIGALTDGLGANPIEKITHRTGWWALVLLTVTLSVTPVRRLTGKSSLVRYRRLLGLFAFFYATLHFLTYLVLDQFFGWSFILEDIAERPFITVGFAAWLMLLTLALTSTTGWIRRLRKNWQRLHRLVYVAAVAGGVHFLWKVKADTREPLVFLVAIGFLLLLRVWAPWKRRPPAGAGRAKKKAPSKGASGPSADGAAGQLA